MRSTIRDLNIAQRTQLTLDDIAEKLNPLLRGWIGYYGRYAPWKLEPMLRHVNLTLRRWTMRKFKRFAGRKVAAALFLEKLAKTRAEGVLVSLGLDQHIEHLAFGVDGPPKVDHSAVDFQINLVEMPSRVGLQATLSSEAAVRLVLKDLYSPEGAILVVDAHRPPFVSQYGDVKRFLAEGLKFPDAAAADALHVPPADVEAIAVTGVGSSAHKTEKNISPHPGASMIGASSRA